jgi:hypothetical protein
LVWGKGIVFLSFLFNEISMQLTAKLIQILPLQTGNGKNGTWKKQDIIVETSDQYPKKICVSVWGDKADASLLKIGNTLTISFDVESREFNGRWYTDVKAWKIESAGNSSAAPAPGPEDIPDSVFEEESDLPF